MLNSVVRSSATTAILVVNEPIRTRETARTLPPLRSQEETKDQVADTEVVAAAADLRTMAAETRHTEEALLTGPLLA